jgi:2',3'-cyclic-nucleotide 2'-phosphodiesterase (5'-nucleotidase family)
MTAPTSRLGVACVALVLASAGTAADEITLSIVGTNDLHGHLFTDDQGRGGLTVLGGFVENLRAGALGVVADTPIERAAGPESALGNLFADAVRAAVPGAEVALSYGPGRGRTARARPRRSVAAARRWPARAARRVRRARRR